MPNTNYRRGRDLEYEVKAIFEKDGYIVTRASSSKGPWDLIAVKEAKDRKKVYLVIVFAQCKRNKLGSSSASHASKASKTDLAT